MMNGMVTTVAGSEGQGITPPKLEQERLSPSISWALNVFELVKMQIFLERTPRPSTRLSIPYFHFSFFWETQSRVLARIAGVVAFFNQGRYNFNQSMAKINTF
jgi:hypothetical protein